MAVYDSVKDITDPKVPAYMKSLAKAEDAEKAYKGFLEFKDVVAKNQMVLYNNPVLLSLVLTCPCSVLMVFRGKTISRKQNDSKTITHFSL